MQEERFAPLEAAPQAGRYTVVAATAEDVEALRALAEVCWRATYRDIYTDAFITSFLARAYSEVGLLHAIANPSNCFLLAKWVVDGAETLVGYAHLGPAFHPGNGPALTEVDLYRLYLHPAHQRRGLGRRLLGVVEAWVQAAGYDRYGCVVHRQNAPARAFYAAQGFVHHPERDTNDECYLVKTLA